MQKALNKETSDSAQIYLIASVHRPLENGRVTEPKMTPKQSPWKLSSLNFACTLYHERALKLRHLKRVSGLRAKAQLMLAAEFGSIAHYAVTVYKTRAIKT